MSSRGADEQPGWERLTSCLRDGSVEAEIIATGLASTVELAASALAVRPGAIVKSVVFEGKRAPVVVVAIVPGDRRAHASKVAAALRTPPLKLASPIVVREWTGYDVGGVPPVGHLRRPPIVIDELVMQHPIVFGGGGDAHHMLRICPAEIMRITSAVVSPVSVAAPTLGTAECDPDALRVR
jgi:prolyl-tRNA editing enzyme YbaK/EbsC (Cys-tRNA(Pro) deacylase)